MRKTSTWVLTLVLMAVLAGVASAGETLGDSIGTTYALVTGHDSMTFNWTGSTYSCSTEGYSQVSEDYISNPTELYIKLSAWNGNTFIDYRAASQRVFTPGMRLYFAQVLSWPFTAENPHVIGYHRFTFEAGSIKDECQDTMYTWGSTSPAHGADAIVAEGAAVASNPWVKEAQMRLTSYGQQSHKGDIPITLAMSVVELEKVLGQSGLNLADLFNTTLTDQYLHAGDYMPGLFVTPSGRAAVATFFNGDGSVTEILLDADENGNWTAGDVVVIPATGK